MFWLGLIIGLIAGGIFGFFMFAMMRVGVAADRQMDEWNQKYRNDDDNHKSRTA